MSAAREYATVGHDVLFGEEAAKDECDVCGAAVVDDDEPSEETPHAVSGRGLYLWARGDEMRREEPPLCPACAAALGLSALARWEIEEEEG